MSLDRPRALAQRVVIFALLLWILMEGELHAPVLSAIVVVAAAAASVALKAPSHAHWRPLALPRLVGFFFVEVLLGGIDVARRALAPSLPIRPALLRFELRLPSGFPTVLFAWLVSLTPGTASVDLEGAALTIHVLDERLPVERSLRELERHVAALFA